MDVKEKIFALLSLYCFTFAIETFFRCIAYIPLASKYGIVFYMLPSNSAWFMYNSIIVQTFLCVLIFAPLLANNHRTLCLLGLKFFDIIPVFIDLIDILSIYDKYSMSLINYAFSFCLIRLFSKFDFVRRKGLFGQLTKQTIYIFDLGLMTLIHMILLEHSITNQFDFIRRFILYVIIDESSKSLSLNSNQLDCQEYSLNDQIIQQTYSKISIILLFLISYLGHFSVFSLIFSGMIFISIYNDTKSCLKEQTCIICFNQKFSYEFDRAIISSCYHQIRSVCAESECLLRYVHTEIEQTFRDDLFCQEENCGVRFDYHTVKNILSLANNQQLIDRYEKYVLHRQLEQMDEFIWCSNLSCSSGQLNKGGQSNIIVTCFHCHQKTCFTHRIAWHEGMTCQEYDENRALIDILSNQWIAANSKKCPKCPWQIEKKDGCDHMTCFKCGHEFCWSCLADFQPIRNEGNHRHRNTCKHYAANSRN